MAVETREYYYTNNDDVVTTVAQCGDFIREHAFDLIGKVIDDKPKTIRTINLEITIKISPATIPTITVNKDTLIPMVIPFESED